MQRKTKVIIGARPSDLSRIQAKKVGKTLSDKFPELEIDFLFQKSLGDLDLSLIHI